MNKSNPSLPKKISDHILYKDERFYSSFPAIVTLKNGNLLLVFRRARETRTLLPKELPEELENLRSMVDHVDPRSQLVQILFDKNLKITTDLTPLPSDPEAADQDASLLMLKNGDILLGSYAWYPVPAMIASAIPQWTYGSKEQTGCSYLFWGGNTRRSFDNGVNWEEHLYIPPSPDSPINIGPNRSTRGGSVRGQPIEVGDTILLPVHRNGCHLYKSIDGGKSWSYHSVIAQDKSGNLRLNETSLYQCDSGKLVAFIRSDGGDDHLIVTESTDNGDSWSPWIETTIVGHPFHPLRLPNGKIFLVYGYRHEPYGIRARVIDPECQNINDSPEIILREDGWCGDLGYPWSTIVDNDKILVVYYFTSDQDGIRHIAATMLTI